MLFIWRYRLLVEIYPETSGVLTGKMRTRDVVRRAHLGVLRWKKKRSCELILRDKSGLVAQPAHGGVVGQSGPVGIINRNTAFAEGEDYILPTFK